MESFRFRADAAKKMQQAIQSAGEVEVFAIGDVDTEGFVYQLEIHCRGNEHSVLALLSRAFAGQVVIHNHPSGVLRASEADMHLAHKYGENGVGFIIVNNSVTKDFWVVEPQKESIKPLDTQLVEDFFTKRLPTVMPHFEARPGQIDMALQVTEAFNNREIAVLEAGTGTGKSLAYLVPSTMWAMQNKSKVAIATYTITLQSQLVHDDIPVLQLAGLEFEYALMKGRNNYICKRRFGEQHKRNPKEQLFADLHEYMENTISGSRADIPFPIPNDIWDDIHSDSEQTLRAKCPHFDSCFYYQDRRKAAKANLLIINHHLLLADILVKNDSGGDGILPKFERLVIDEGHHLEDSATSLLNSHLSSRSITNAIGPLLSNKKRQGALEGMSSIYFGANSVVSQQKKNEALQLIDEVGVIAHEIQEKSNDWFFEVHQYALPTANGSKRIKQPDTQTEEWQLGIRPQIDEAQGTINTITNRLHRLAELVSEVPENLLLHHPQAHMDLTRVNRRLLSHLGFLRQFLQPEDDSTGAVDNGGLVRWIERTSLRGKNGEKIKSAKLCLAPIEVAPLIREQLLVKIPSIVSCSATLTVNQSFEHYQRQIGLHGIAHHLQVKTKILPSPFDYPNQAILAIPKDLPNPNTDDYLKKIAPVVVQCIHIAGGGIFVLCTSYKAVDQLYELCRAHLSARYALFKQGEMGRNQLLANFIQTPNSVLFGADSFWEGVSVTGDDLKMIIIPRLPFRVPDEPVHQARHEKIVAQGGNPFKEYSLPQAALRLRQGFGRLIRTQRDRGSVVVLDKRISNMWYGQYFLHSLPPVKQVSASIRETLIALDTFHNPQKYKPTLQTP